MPHCEKDPICDWRKDICWRLESLDTQALLKIAEYLVGFLWFTVTLPQGTMDADTQATDLGSK
jgi:hypothetical protein